MGAGRFICVAVPFILSVVSIVTLLIVGLSGVTSSTNINLFDINTKNISVSLTDLQDLNLVSRAALPDADADPVLVSRADADTNASASTLGLADDYRFFLWNYQEVRSSKSNKSTPQFHYARRFQNITSITNVDEALGKHITTPSDVKDAMKTLDAVLFATQIVLIAAIVAHGVTLLSGIFACFSRIGSCCTWLFSSVALVCTVAVAVLSTVISLVISHEMKDKAGKYGVTSDIGHSWLIVVWISAAAALASGLFWLFSACCCASSSKNHDKAARDEAEKGLGGAGPRGYQPLEHPNHSSPYSAPPSNEYVPQYGIPMGNVKTANPAQAYEPYSHHAV